MHSFKETLPGHRLKLHDLFRYTFHTHRPNLRCTQIRTSLILLIIETQSLPDLVYPLQDCELTFLTRTFVRWLVG